MYQSRLRTLYRHLFKPGPIRRLTAARRALPDFLIIGAMRSGTTALHDTLARHPRVIPAIKKEIHFFDLEFHRGIGWYRAHFPYQTRMRGHITGEASPYYLFHPLAPGRAAQTVPQARLIALLRNPVDRAYSHYWHGIRLGYETLSFKDAIEQEAERLAGEEERLRRGPSFPHQLHSYLARGLYAQQLERWLAHFPKESLLVLQTEALEHHPAPILHSLCRFLHIPPAPLTINRSLNRARYPEMRPQTRSRLVEFFRPHNQRLYQLLGETFDWDH